MTSKEQEQEQEQDSDQEIEILVTDILENECMWNHFNHSQNHC